MNWHYCHFTRNIRNVYCRRTFNPCLFTQTVTFTLTIPGLRMNSDQPRSVLSSAAELFVTLYPLSSTLRLLTSSVLYMLQNMLWTMSSKKSHCFPILRNAAYLIVIRVQSRDTSLFKWSMYSPWIINLLLIIIFLLYFY